MSGPTAAAGSLPSRRWGTPTDARMLAAADVFAALTADRAHPAALAPAQAARVVADEVAAGRLDRSAATAVVEAAGLPRSDEDVAWDADRSDRGSPGWPT